MNTSTLSKQQQPSRTVPFEGVASAGLPADAPTAGRIVFKLLQRLQVGSVLVKWPDGSLARFGEGQGEGQGDAQAAVHLHVWSVCSAALRSGDIGFAEGYIAGHWSTPDLTALLTVLAANRDQIETAVYGSWWGRLAYRLRHLLNQNSRGNSRKNVHAHYDLGNEFYRLWLDRTMNYSSAWFDGDMGRPLAEAQEAKVRRALRQAGVLGGPPGQRVLEIGCGWGALAEIAAVEARADVVGVTLSTEQLDWAQRRLSTASGAGPRADLRLQDYRDIQDGPFDAVLSIEMFEAVGQAYWPTFFQTLHRLLKPGGRACLQTITIRDDLFERYSRSTDFIQQYIFPGGMLPSDEQFRQHAAQAGLRVVEALPFGPDYAETLRRWRAAFDQQQRQVQGIGFDARFMRIWQFYLCYCEAAFDTGNTSVVQYTLSRPGEP